MSYQEKDILHETTNFWVLDVGKNGFEVYRKTLTHSVRCASIGRSLGLDRAINECERREALCLS